MLDKLDPPSTLIVVGSLMIIMPYLKINGRSIEVIKGKGKYISIIGTIAVIVGVSIYLFGFMLTPTEKIPENIATETETSGETTAGKETPTEIETVTETETTSTNTQSHDPYVSPPQSIAVPPQVDVSPYLTWRFVTSDHKPNMKIDGGKFVLATIHIENSGDVPISSGPSCWKFVYNGTNYSHDYATMLYNSGEHPDIDPGESGTFTIAYVVKGNPTDNASISYSNPYFFD